MSEVGDALNGLPAVCRSLLILVRIVGVGQHSAPLGVEGTNGVEERVTFLPVCPDES